MFDFDAGYKETWDCEYDQPIKKPIPRVFPGGHPLYDEVEWLKGYDTGLAHAALYREGFKIGLEGKPDTTNPYGTYKNPAIQEWSNTGGKWHGGWYRGRRIYLRKLVRVIVLADKKSYVAVINHFPFDDLTGQTPDYEGGTERRPLKKADIILGCVEYLLEKYGHDEPIPTDMKTILSYYTGNVEGDGSFCNAAVITSEENKKQVAENEYNRIEESARNFADSCGHKIGSVQFINALNKAVRHVRDERAQWNSGERRMEEWAACMYSGAGREVYFDDLNFENGRYSSRLASLKDVWDYMERKFPIMMLRYQEWKARKRQVK